MNTYKLRGTTKGDGYKLAPGDVNEMYKRSRNSPDTANQEPIIFKKFCIPVGNVFLLIIDDQLL